MLVLISIKHESVEILIIFIELIVYKCKLDRYYSSKSEKTIIMLFI